MTDKICILNQWYTCQFPDGICRKADSYKGAVLAYENVIAAPVFSSALSNFDGCCGERLPVNLLQVRRTTLVRALVNAHMLNVVSFPHRLDRHGGQYSFDEIRSVNKKLSVLLREKGRSPESRSANDVFNAIEK